ncbi:hypothetical protein, partial [Anaerobutyricum soehngenii]|uniref:hypothetical protein n=1 Tax=Anaerobutyricum soehngenii TaxID=105843 RepID=UPI00196A7265
SIVLVCRQGWRTLPKANISAIFKVPMEPFFQLHFFIGYFTLPKNTSDIISYHWYLSCFYNLHSKLEQLIEDFISTFFFNRQGLLTPILYFHRPAVDGAIISQVGSYQYLQKAHFFIDGFPSVAVPHPII